jgi:DNA-binding transcriptional LysR family regulator
VETGDLDAAVVGEPQFMLAKTCSWEKVVEDPLVVLAPGAMAGADAHEHLKVEPIIRYDRTAVVGQIFERYHRDQGIRPRERLEVDGAVAIAAIVDRGLGVSLLPDWSSQWVRGMSLCRIVLPGRPASRSIGVVWRTDGPRAPLAREVLLEAQAIFGDAAG